MSTYTNPLTDYSPQMEFEGVPSEWPATESRQGVLSESEEMELAAEFLDLEDEGELENFLGDLVHKIGSALGGIAKSPAGKAIGGVLKGVAKAALPVAAGAVGTLIGGPIGGMIGGNLASMAGSALGLELEGMSPEDREFEASRRFIRFATEAIANALRPGAQGDPWEIANRAAVDAAREYAPGLMNIAPNGHKHTRHSGHWVRRGDRIVLFGI